ncbi:MAG: hypothetical protein ABW003_02120 [Microvirga sp.]
MASNSPYAAINGNSEYYSSGVFSQWGPGSQSYQKMADVGFPGGYKMHLSAHLDDAEQVAGLVLPLLRDMKIHHKIVTSPHNYERLNSGKQQGKFITIYCGPSMDTFLSIVKNLDPLLMMSRTRPGPQPSIRIGGGLETRIGTTGHLTYFAIDDFRR